MVVAAALTEQVSDEHTQGKDNYGTGPVPDQNA